MPAIQSRALKLAVTAVYVLAQCCVLWPHAVRAASADAAEAVGYLAVARQATVNNAAAAQGLVVLSNSRIKTAAEGVAGVSFGKAGRLSVGRGADFLLTYSKSDVGGKLDAGRIAFSVPAGVSVTLRTGNAVIQAGSPQGADVAVEFVNGVTRVVAISGGEVNVTSGSATKTLKTGESAEADAKGVKLNAAPGGAPPATPQAGGVGGFLTFLQLAGLVTSITGIVISGIQLKKVNDLQRTVNRLNPSPVQ